MKSLLTDILCALTLAAAFLVLAILIMAAY